MSQDYLRICTYIKLLRESSEVVYFDGFFFSFFVKTLYMHIITNLKLNNELFIGKTKARRKLNMSFNLESQYIFVKLCYSIYV